jgi:hypothetical protein
VSEKWQKGCNTTRSTVVPLLSTDSGSIGLVFEVRMGFGIFPMIWSHPTLRATDAYFNPPTNTYTWSNLQLSGFDCRFD